MWTQIKDDTGGGHSITGFCLLFMECSGSEACAIFEQWTGQDHTRSTPEYGSIISMKEFDSLEQASAFDRGCDHDRETRRWVERAGSWRPHQPFEPWRAKQRLDPSPEEMREQANDWDADRNAQAAIATLPFLGPLLLPIWLASIRPPKDEEPASSSEAQAARERALDWGASLEAMAERAVWSPQDSGQRDRCLKNLQAASEALKKARENDPGAEPYLKEASLGAERAWVALFEAADWSLCQAPDPLARLLVELKMERALAACLRLHAPELGEAGLIGIDELCAERGFEAGREATQAAGAERARHSAARSMSRRGV